MPVETNPAARHIPALDGLRALAITGVIFCHINNTWDWEQVAHGPLSQPVSVLCGWGFVGVNLFFVLSGFLITGLLYEAKGGAGYFRNFYARRALRIMPLYYGFLLLTLVILPALLAHAPARLAGLLNLPGITAGDTLSLVLYFANFQIAFLHRSLDVFTPFWSLAVEEHFYLFWPLAVWSLARRNLMRVCLVGAGLSLARRIAVVCAGADDLIAQLATPGALDAPLLGGWLALARRDPADWANVRRLALPAIVCAGAFVLSLVAAQMNFTAGLDLRATDKMIQRGAVIVTLGITALAIFFTALLARVVGAPARSPLRRVLEHPSLTAIGKYSYAIYVFHSLILLYTYRLAAGRLAPYLPLSAAKLIVALWLLSVSFAVAWLSYHGFEIHFLKLKRFFENGRQPFPQVAAAPQSVKV